MSACSKTNTDELILYDFESESVLDNIHWKCRTLLALSSFYVSHGKTSLKLEMFPSSYPGFSPALKFHDWSDYKKFCFEVYNPSPDKFKLILRIDDKKESLEYGDRYNNNFTIMPGANTITIPLNTLKTSKTDRLLKLKKIYKFLVFISHPEKKYTLYLDYFRLLAY
ncbi:hypothetical protein KAJ27_01460 [bacterium]|nr:hypothetical protein [bacterium]